MWEEEELATCGEGGCGLQRKPKKFLGGPVLKISWFFGGPVLESSWLPCLRELKKLAPAQGVADKSAWKICKSLGEVQQRNGDGVILFLGTRKNGSQTLEDGVRPIRLKPRTEKDDMVSCIG